MTVYGVAMNSLTKRTIQKTNIRNTIKSNTSIQNFVCFFRKPDIVEVYNKILLINMLITVTLW